MTSTILPIACDFSPNANTRSLAASTRSKIKCNLSTERLATSVPVRAAVCVSPTARAAASAAAELFSMPAAMSDVRLPALATNSR